MKDYNYIGWLIAIALLIYIYVSQRHCGSVTQHADTSTTVVYVYDTNTYTPQVPPPTPRSSVIRLPAPAAASDKPLTPVDTAAIVHAYFMAHFYEQTIQDSNITATIRDSVYNNNITWRNFSYRLLRPTAIITNTIIKPVEARNQLYAGFGASVGVLGSSPTIGPELLFVTKNKTAYRAAFQLPGTVSASIYFKLGK
jgi:hypothetical protein